MDIAGPVSSARKPALAAARVTVKCMSSSTVKPESVSASPSCSAFAPSTSSGTSSFTPPAVSRRSKVYCTSDAVSALPLEKTTPLRSVKV